MCFRNILLININLFRITLNRQLEHNKTTVFLVWFTKTKYAVLERL